MRFYRLGALIGFAALLAAPFPGMASARTAYRRALRSKDVSPAHRPLLAARLNRRLAMAQQLRLGQHMPGCALACF